jgi:hypothetical protein
MDFFHFDILPTYIYKALMTKSTISTNNSTRVRVLVGRDGESLLTVQYTVDLDLEQANIFFVLLRFISVSSMARFRFLSDGSAG